MTYTAPEMLLIIAGIGTLVVNAINAWRNGSKIERTLEKAAVIEGHVNSKETKLTEQILSFQRENEILKGIIRDKDKIASMLAQSTAAGAALQHLAQNPMIEAIDKEVPLPVTVVNEPLAVVTQGKK